MPVSNVSAESDSGMVPERRLSYSFLRYEREADSRVMRAARHSAKGRGGILHAAHAHGRELCQRREHGRDGSRKSVATEKCCLEQCEDRERLRNRAGEVVLIQEQPRDPGRARETGKNVGDRADEIA
jgi:hypothetical protein